MTRPTKRSLERRVGELCDGDDDPPLEIRITDHLVMAREQAEREGREILGPAEDAPPENDCVRVAHSRSGTKVIRMDP